MHHGFTSEELDRLERRDIRFERAACLALLFSILLLFLTGVFFLATYAVGLHASWPVSMVGILFTVTGGAAFVHVGRDLFLIGRGKNHEKSV